MAAINPKKTNLILTVLTLLLVVGNLGLAYFANKKLSDQSKKVNQLAQQVKASENDVHRLGLIKKQMADIEDVPRLLDNLVAIKNKNKYQEEIIEVIKQYADRSGLTIIQIDFVSSKISKSKTTVSVKVRFQMPVSYDNLLKFFKLTENSLLRMQITDFAITKQPQTSNVTIGDININVYSK